MNAEYVQNLRYKLQKRVRRLNSANYPAFHYMMKQFWGFLKSYPVFQGIIDDLEKRCPSAENKANIIFDNDKELYGEKELESAAISYYLIKRCIDSDVSSEVKIGQIYGSFGKTHDESLDIFKQLFLEPFYEYLDEQLDDQRAILAILKRYKHKCEWFQRKLLYGLSEDTKRGEKNLALHLYEYLHDQGLDFSIEPNSASGEADLVDAQNSDDPLIADAKIFNPEKGKRKSYILDGFNQLYQYTLDFNESFGYLIIYNTSGRDLRFALSNQSQSTPYVSHNNKTIFLITIDIFLHEKSASKRGNLKTVEITEEDLIKITEEKIDE